MAFFSPLPPHHTLFFTIITTITTITTTMPSTATIVTAAVAASTLGYLVYFDHRRRHDTAFRRSLRRAELNYQKQQASLLSAEKDTLKLQIETTLRSSLANDPLPEGLDEREKFFVAEIARADELLNQGEAQFVSAALAFYRALAVYPNPVDLLGIYDKSIRQPVLDIVRTMVLLEPPAAIKSVFGGSAAAGAASAGAPSAAGPDFSTVE